MGFNDTRCVLEPAGALAIAGVRKYVREKGLVGHTVRKYALYHAKPLVTAAAHLVFFSSGSSLEGALHAYLAHK